MRILGPELLRFVSVLLIVWFHGHGMWFDSFVTTSLACLALMSIILPIKRNFTLQVDVLTFVSKRANRLLIPFFVFWCLYGILAVVSENELFPSPWIILAGHGPHLWYLTFAFIASCCGYVLDSKLGFSSLAKSVAILLPICIALLVSSDILQGISLPKPIRQYLTFLPAIPIAVLLARITRQQKNPNFTNWLVFVISIIFVGISCISSQISSNTLGLHFGAATLLVSFSLLWKREASDTTLHITSTAMAVYLLHPAVAFVLIRSGVPYLDHTGGNVLALSMIIISLLLAMFLRNTFLKVLL